MQNFPDKQRGTVLIFFLLMFPVLIAFYFMAYEVTHFVNYSMRLRLALDNAAILVAREGPAASSEELHGIANEVLFRNIPNGLRDQAQNSASLMNARVTMDPNSDLVEITAPSSPSAITRFMAASLLDKQLVSPTRVERYYQPQETAISLDASLSMNDKGLYQRIKTAMLDFVSYGYQEVNAARTPGNEDSWISLNAYSEFVNVGERFQNKLISQTSREVADKWQAIARQEGYFTSNDMLASAGPESKRRAACLKRMKNSSWNEANYIARMQRPPMAASASKYDLHLSSAQEARDIAGVLKRTLRQSIPDELLPNYQFLNPANQATGQEGVGSSATCPSMPLLELSNNAEKMQQHINMYFPTWSTGTDEGFMWAWKTLMPEWREVWGQSQVPRDYGLGIEKRIILFTDGEQNEGYGDGGGLNRLYQKACDSMAQRDQHDRPRVKVYTILYASNSATFSTNKPYVKAVEYCAEHTDGKVVNIVGNQQQLLQFFKTLSVRQYWVKKTS